MGTGSYTKRAVWRMTETGLTLVSRRTVPYDGPWEFCKGDPTAQASEQQQMGFNQQLMQIFQAQYGQQTATLKTLVVRQWVLRRAPARFRGLYLAYGKRISETPLRWLFRPVFGCVLAVS